METDERLYQRMVAGDLGAFDVLYARYERSLFGFIRRYLRDRAEAEDVFHEAFLGVLHAGTIEFKEGSFRAWLYQVARNLCLNRLRKVARGARAGATVAATEPEFDGGVHDAIERGQASVALGRAVEKLPEPLAEVYHLRASGMSYEEMAHVLGSPLGTVKSRMHELVRRLKEEMRPWTAG
jgi:RNA polymerase sigma-70 factor (ECF subfamily)